MRFTIATTTITVHDDRPSRYPTLFGPIGRKLTFQDDGSSFNDSEHLWRYVFRCEATPKDGDMYVFATSERTVVAEVRGGEVVTADCVIAVERAASGAPLAIDGTPRPKITIMIVTMNRREFLEKTLWYIYETSTDEERDIWIWDNASTDDTADFLGTMVGWPGVRVFRSKTDLGVAGPRRKMLSTVRTPYIFTLDDDVWMINKGWVSAVNRALDAEPSIHQLVVAQGYVHSTNNFGSAHGVLTKPFFPVPIFQPQDPGPEMVVAENWMPFGREDWVPPFVPSGTAIIRRDGEFIMVPTSGGALPFAASGGSAGWRTADVAALVTGQDRHLVCDLREVWSFPLAERGTREGLLFRYGAFHPCPGPIWHLGHGERYWADKVRHSEAIYNRSAAEQARWLEAARAASGWGRSIDDPDEVL